MDKKEAELMFQEAAINLSKEKLHFHTIQFLEKKENNKYNYYPLGSGVLIQIEEYFLVFTAFHVIENFASSPIYINTRIGVQRVIGSFHKATSSPDKQVDLSYVILDRMLGLLLIETYQFLPIAKVCHSHIPKETTNYMVCGYPEKNIWEKNGDVYTGSTHFLLSMSNEKIYRYYNIDAKENYVLNFAGRGIDLKTGAKSDKINDPYGMSGCGLWFLQVRPEIGKIVLDYFLIGIMIMFKKSTHHVLIGHKIELLMADLEKTGLLRFDWQVLSK